MVNIDELAAMSGEEEYKGGGFRLGIDEVKLNGNAGTFTRTFFSGNKGDDGKYPSETIGSELKVIFLKLRRKMVQFDSKKTMVRCSNEYNSRTQQVLLSTGERLVEADAKKRFGKDLKVNVIVYGLLVEGKKIELVKIPVTGGSLYEEIEASEDGKPNDQPLRLYNYQQTFEKGEHTFQFFTNITTSEKEKETEEGVKTYYVMAFERGAELSAKQMERVSTEMKELIALLEENDKRFGESFAAKVKSDAAFNSAFEPVPYPTAESEGINPEDIPF